MIRDALSSRWTRRPGARAWLLGSAAAYALASDAVAQPPGAGPETVRDATLDAAYGVPSEGAEYDPTTRANPGFTERAHDATPDKAYGSSAQSVGVDGSVTEGLEIRDFEGLMPNEGGYVDDTPGFHVVQGGDTLWDISEIYLGDAYLWPKLWSWNEQVTNAHWIFPGDRIRLRDPAGGSSRGADGAALRLVSGETRKRATPQTYVLSSIAFVDDEDFDTAMKVIGGGDAQVMMSTLDTAYMSYEKEHPPVPGERLIVYAPTEKIRAIKGREVVGHVVQIMGEIEIDSVAREAAEGTIVSALNPIERGYRVGPLRRVFRRVEQVPAERAASGLIVATLTTTGPIPIKGSKTRKDKYVLAGEEVFVVTDLGEDDGIREGNVLEVVQKGDGYTKKRIYDIPYEEGWPRRILGEVLIVEVQPHTSLGVVTHSLREFERGDHVELRTPGLDDRSENAPASTVHQLDE